MFPFESEKEDRPWFLLLALVALAQAAGLLAVAWFAAGGHFMLPLDDSYIHLQYARMIAADSPLVYTRGMAPSGGMTSPLYVLILAPMHFLGIGGAKGAFMAFALGAALWALLPIWVYQLTKRLSNSLCGSVAGGLVLANGHLLWNFLSGMETGLFTVIIVGAVLGAQVWWQGEKPYGRLIMLACLALLPLVRPEGAVLLVAAAIILLRRRGEHPSVPLWLVVACFLPLVVWLVLLQVATGDWRPAGLAIKGLMSQPSMTLVEKFGYGAETLAGVAGKFYFNTIPDALYAQFKGDSFMPYVPIGLGILALLGGAYLLVTEWRTGRPAGGSFLALAWVLGLASLSASLLPFIHQQRYVAPYTVLAIILAVVAIRRIAMLFQQHEDNVVKALGLGLLLASAPSLPFWMAEYGRNGRDIYHLLRVATFSLQDERESIAITDAGVLAYYTNAPMYDLVGLGSREFTAATTLGEAATLEALSRLPQERRPRTLISYPNWWSAAFPLGATEWAVSIPRTSITSGTSLQRRTIEWQLIERGDASPATPQEKLVLALDVSDLESERLASYRAERGLYDSEPRRWPQPLAPVARFHRAPTVAPDEGTTATLLIVGGGEAVDGGRTVRGESFPLSPGQSGSLQLVLHARVGPPMAPIGPAATGLRVSVVSATTGFAATADFPIAGMDRGVVDARIDIADLVDKAGGRTWRIRIDPLPGEAAWGSYHYWVMERLQRQP